MRWLVVCLLALSAGAVRASDGPPAVVFRGVTVIDVEAGRRVPGRAVVVTGPTITAVVDDKGFMPPEGAAIVDGSGKYLIPGLWDMHAHIVHESFLPLFLANGVTGVREMHDMLGGRFVVGLRDEIRAGRRLGPRIVAAVEHIDARREPQPPGKPTADTPEQGRELVRRRKAAGADFIKVYSGLSPEVYRAVLDEAKKVGLPVAGHCPERVPAGEAAALGQRSIEHLTGVALSCSKDEDALRKELDRAMAGPAYDTAVLDRITLKAIDSPDPGKQKALFAAFVRHRTWQTPTLVVHRPLPPPQEREARPDPRRKYLHPMLTRPWRYTQNLPEQRAISRALFDYGRRTVRAMHAAGVPLLAGTDVGLAGEVYPGFGLADELELLAGCGLSPAEALRTATLNPALYLGEEKTSGTVAAGKRADLVLLAADPLADIGNVRKVAGAVANGRWLPEAELTKMLAQVAARAAK
jgi:imidazolonepropionase-like amidohydrolase